MIYNKIKRLNELELKTSSENEKSLDDYFMLREEILKEFGLPFSSEYTSLLEFGNDRLTDHEIQKVNSALHEASKEYLTTTPSTDHQLLLEAIHENTSAFEVLPKLGIETHVYTIFIYNEYLLKERDTIDSILEIFKLTRREDVLNQLGMIHSTNDEQISKLEKLGLKYVLEFAKTYCK